MKKGRTTVAIHNYDATSFTYVKVPALSCPLHMTQNPGLGRLIVSVTDKSC